MNHILGSLFLAALAIPPANAQVPCWMGDDGFAGPCCERPEPNLPDFPELRIEGVYACIKECELSEDFKVLVELSKPDFYHCDSAIIDMRVSPSTPGGPQFSGRVIAKYARTWLRVDDGRQVWRFLLSGDWEFDPAFGDVFCPNPPHDDPSHVIGSIDYACDPNAPGTDAVAVALNLSHMPGCLSHANGSVRPIVGPRAHEQFSYHLVAPDTFTFLVGNDIAGVTPAESLRSSPTGNCFPWTYECRNEARIVDGELATDFKNCLCIDAIDGGPYVHSKIEGRVDCNGSTTGYSTYDGWNPVVPTGLVGMRLGAWNGPNFPGDQELTVYVGYFNAQDPCNPTSADEIPRHITGVGTTKPAGFLLGPQPGFVFYDQFVDLQDNLIPQTHNSIPYPGPLPSLCIPLQRGFGAPAYSSLVWNLNPVQ